MLKLFGYVNNVLFIFFKWLNVNDCLFVCNGNVRFVGFFIFGLFILLVLLILLCVCFSFFWICFINEFILFFEMIFLLISFLLNIYLIELCLWIFW